MAYLVTQGTRHRCLQQAKQGWKVVSFRVAVLASSKVLDVCARSAKKILLV